MKLIADSGSSKTTWALLSSNKVTHFSSRGLNPYFYTAAEISQILKEELPPDLPFQQINTLHFFGAGCSSSDRNQMVTAGLQELFKNAQIAVAHDMYGAALALCKDQPGIACILGTGSNSCYFEQQRIIQSVPAPGFILADEGSGSYMGKQLIRDYIRKDLPDVLIQALDKAYRYTEAEIIKKVYSEKNPNRFLASFTRFIYDHISHPYCEQLVLQSFEDFFVSNIQKYPQHQQVPIHFTGSVAYYFKPYLTTVLQKHNTTPGIVIQEPMPALITYFQSRTTF